MLIEIDVSQIREFSHKLRNADFKQAAALIMESMGIEFLSVVQDEIISRDVIDTKQLLNSFTKGENGNIWAIEDDGLTVEVGSSVDYASYVNYGHWQNPKGVDTRFVPGYWAGDRFVYDPSAKGGMVLKQKWVEGKHFWESALRILEKMMPEIFESAFEEWLKQLE